MRQPRLKVPPDHPAGFYHCISRIVDRQLLLGDFEKRHFLALLREYEAFCEVRVLTYCLMGNHFHLLVEVPQAPSTPPSPQAILKKLSQLTALQDLAKAKLDLQLAQNRPDALQAWVRRYTARMWDISAFLKLLKQRFSQWYNRTHNRQGTLWEGRFRSLIVEGSGQALGAVASYIDLNPTRAHLVSDPKDWIWSGYGEALAGGPHATQGLQRLLQGVVGIEVNQSQALEDYRVLLHLKGHEANSATDSQGQPLRGGLSHQQVLDVLKARGRLPLYHYLRCRVRYFTAGAVLGSKPFVQKLFLHHRHRFPPSRLSGPRRLKGLSIPLFSWRNLQKDIFG